MLRRKVKQCEGESAEERLETAARKGLCGCEAGSKATGRKRLTRVWERRDTAGENKAGLSREWQGASGWGEVGVRRRMRSERCVGAGRVCPVGHWETSDFIQ